MIVSVIFTNGYINYPDEWAMKSYDYICSDSAEIGDFAIVEAHNGKFKRFAIVKIVDVRNSGESHDGLKEIYMIIKKSGNSANSL